MPTILTPCSVSPKPQTASGGRGDGHDRAHLRQDVRGPFADPKAAQEGLEAAAHPEEKGQRSEADHRGIGIDVAEVGHHRFQKVHQALALRVDAENGRELAGRDLDARGGDEARDDRVAEEVREKPQPQQPHGQQQQPRDHGERDGRPQILRCSLGRDRCRGGRGHEAGHRDGADRERARGAEDRVEHERRHRGIQPDLRRQPRQQRIGQRLRDQHDRDDPRHDQVVGERLAGVFGPPVQDREITAGQAGDVHAAPPCNDLAGLLGEYFGSNGCEDNRPQSPHDGHHHDARVRVRNGKSRRQHRGDVTRAHPERHDASLILFHAEAEAIRDQAHPDHEQGH